MGILIEFLFGLVADLLLEIFGWVIVELIGRAAVMVVKSFLGLEAKYLLPICGLIGLALGAISVGLFPHHLVKPSRFHGINLIVSPIAVGLLVQLLSSIREKKGKEAYKFEAFSFGFLFALCFGLVRFMKLG